MISIETSSVPTESLPSQGHGAQRAKIKPPKLAQGLRNCTMLRLARPLARSWGMVSHGMESLSTLGLDVVQSSPAVLRMPGEVQQRYLHSRPNQPGTSEVAEDSSGSKQLASSVRVY